MFEIALDSCDGVQLEASEALVHLSRDGVERGTPLRSVPFFSSLTVIHFSSCDHNHQTSPTAVRVGEEKEREETGRPGFPSSRVVGAIVQ